MKKNTWIIIVILLVIIIGGGILLAHKSPKKSPTTSSQSTVTVNNSVIITKNNSSIGNYLADPSGAALYTYSGDSSGVSNCTGSCLSAWPAYQDKGSTTGLPTGISTIKRTDNGQVQYTYKGLPLYFFGNDSNGQVTGNGVSGFSVAKP